MAPPPARGMRPFSQTFKYYDTIYDGILSQNHKRSESNSGRRRHWLSIKHKALKH